MVTDGENMMDENLNEKDGKSSSRSRRSGEYLHKLFKDAKSSFKSGDYKNAKVKTEKLEGKIDDIRRYQEKTFSEFIELENRIDYRGRQGFDVKEPREILQEAREALREMKYELAFDKMEEAWESLERALFVPFPFLEKDVEFKTVIRNEANNIICGLQINNRMRDHLGEILLTLKTPSGFEDIPERRVGEIGPYDTRTIKEKLNVVKDAGVNNDLSDLIKDDKIVLRSYLDCDYGDALHGICVRNISDKILTDIEIRPFIPDSLETKEKKRIIDILEPSAEESVTFELQPKTPGKALRMGDIEEHTEDEIFEEGQGESRLALVRDNYILQGERLDETYSMISKHLSEERNPLLISQINIGEFEDDFGIDNDEVDFIWISDAEEGPDIIPPEELHGELDRRIRDFISNHDEGLIFIDSLGKLKAENGFQFTLDYIEDIWAETKSTEFNILAYVNPRILSEAELRIIEEKFRIYYID